MTGKKALKYDCREHFLPIVIIAKDKTVTDKIVEHISDTFGLQSKVSNRLMRILIFFVLPVLMVYIVWASYMWATNSWGLFREYFYMTLTMVFGSFVAGASSEGGGAVAFPVMTLVFKILPSVARTFSLAIQSIGMTAATLWIIAKQIPIEKKYLKLAMVGGSFGIIFGSYFVAPYLAPAYSKMLFVSFWLSFGLALFAINHIRQRDTCNQLPSLDRKQRAELLAIGFIGGILSSILGSGIDICSFAFVTMKYNLSEKVATPTSVILMASNAIVGFLLHQFVLQDVQPEVYNYWLVSIPVVVLGAPLGALVINKLKRLHIAVFLYSIIIIQFIGAVVIIRPHGELLVFSLLTFIVGIVIFFFMSKRAKPPKLM